jgi:hypothetical protein
MARRAAWNAQAVEDLGPTFFGSSDDFKKQLKNEHPELLVPEGRIVYLGEASTAWGPEHETPHEDGETCPHEDRITPGSLLCCPKCQRSGFERKLAEQRRLVGYPSPEKPKTAQQRPIEKNLPATVKIDPPAWWRDLSWSRNNTAGKKTG